MNTIQIKGSYKRVSQFLKEGGRLLENKIDNKIVMSYYDYLKSLNNKENTICKKDLYIYLNNILYLKKKILKHSIKKIYTIILKNALSYHGV